MSFRSFSPKQKTVLTWWLPGSPHYEKEAIVCDGAVRSGKTMAMGLSFFLWAMTVFDSKRFGICGKTIASLRRNVLGEILPKLEELGAVCREKRTENLLTVRLFGHENSFYIFGGRDESSASLIQGITFAGVLLDEVALMPRSFVEQACARCSVTGSRLWFNCNPEGPGHWFYKTWIMEAEKRNCLRLHFTMVGSAPESCEKWYISCDYGTVNPTSMGLWGRKSGVWYRVKEFYFDSRLQQRQMTDAEYADALERLAGGREITAVIVDPSAASFMEVLRRRGHRVQKAKNRHLRGLRRLPAGNGLLRLGRQPGAGEKGKRSCHGRYALFRVHRAGTPKRRLQRVQRHKGKRNCSL